MNLDSPPGRTTLVRLLGIIITMGGLWAAFIGGVVLSG